VLRSVPRIDRPAAAWLELPLNTDIDVVAQAANANASYVYQPC
jgi:hypothetical protein